MGRESSRVGDVLGALGVPHDKPMYVQASMDWVPRAGFEIGDVMHALVDWLSPHGTLVMPTYPFVTSHLDYLEGEPRFDVRTTPAMTGVLAEIFRRRPEVVRSLDPDFSVCALGPDAEVIAGAAVPKDADPFGPRSSYQRVLDRHATFVGLGVSLNTSSFIHLIDSRAGSSYPCPVYQPRLFKTTVVDRSGGAHTVHRAALRPEFQRLTSPSAVIELMQPSPAAFQTIEVNGARFFRWDLDIWSDWCLSHARARAADRQWPCWLERLADGGH